MNSFLVALVPADVTLIDVSLSALEPVLGAAPSAAVAPFKSVCSIRIFALPLRSLADADKRVLVPRDWIHREKTVQRLRAAARLWQPAQGLIPIE